MAIFKLILPTTIIDSNFISCKRFRVSCVDTSMRNNFIPFLFGRLRFNYYYSLNVLPKTKQERQQLSYNTNSVNRNVCTRQPCGALFILLNVFNTMEFDIKAYSHGIERLICSEKSQIAIYCMRRLNISLALLFGILACIVSVLGVCTWIKLLLCTVLNYNLSVIGHINEIETRCNQVRTIINL